MAPVSDRQPAGIAEWFFSLPPWHEGEPHWSEREPLKDVFYATRVTDRFQMPTADAIIESVKRNDYRTEEVRLVRQLVAGRRKGVFGYYAWEALGGFMIEAGMKAYVDFSPLDRREFALLLAGKSHARGASPSSLGLKDVEDIIHAVEARSWSFADITFVWRFLRTNHISFGQDALHRLGDFFAVMRGLWTVGAWSDEAGQPRRTRPVQKTERMADFGVIEMPADVETAQPLDTGSLEEVFDNSADDAADAAVGSALGLIGPLPDIKIAFK